MTDPINKDQTIDNSIRYKWFLFGMMFFGGISIVPVSLGIYNWFTIMGPIVVILGELIYYGVCQPGYFHFHVDGDGLHLRVSPFQETDMVIPTSNLWGFTIKSSVFGLCRTLELYKKTPKGVMKTRAFYISLLPRDEVSRLRTLLLKFCPEKKDLE